MTTKVKMFFFPHIAGGHLLPMIDTARFFASHPDVQATIITTSGSIKLFQTAIDRDRKAGHDISFHTMDLPKEQFGLPDDIENYISSIPTELRYKLFMAVMRLSEPLKHLLQAHRPDCLVSDVVHSWTLDVANKVGIPRIAFRVTSVFALCSDESLLKFKPHEKVRSDTDLFLLPGLPHEVRLTRSRLPQCHCDPNVSSFFDLIHQAEKESYGVIANSFYDMEPDYYDYAKNVMGLKLWMVGPVSQSSNKSKNDKSQRGMGRGNDRNVQDEEMILKWLDARPKRSVVYMSFGSEACICKEQFHEIAHGLEASGHPFIWVARSTLYDQENNDEQGLWFPQGFEQRMRETNQGLVMKTWVPQLLILGHPSLSTFLTHCGWNSAIEGLSNGVPMITWPLFVDQFNNENLLVDVLKVGIRVGNEESSFMSIDPKPKVTVTRDKIAAAVTRMASNGEEVQEMRTRVQHYADLARKTVEQGGTSYRHVCALVEELKQLVPSKSG